MKSIAQLVPRDDRPQDVPDVSFGRPHCVLRTSSEFLSALVTAAACTHVISALLLIAGLIASVAMTSAAGPSRSCSVGVDAADIESQHASEVDLCEPDCEISVSMPCALDAYGFGRLKHLYYRSDSDDLEG